MESFLAQLGQLIAEQDLSVIEVICALEMTKSVIEVIGALEPTKAELMADVLDDEGESID